MLLGFKLGESLDPGTRKRLEFLLQICFSMHSSLFASLINTALVSPVAQSCPILCDPMNHSILGLPVHHQLLEFTQIHVHRVGDAIQPSHLLSSPSPRPPIPPSIRVFSKESTLRMRWPKYWEFQLQHQSFQ